MSDHITDEMVEAAWDDAAGALLSHHFEFDDMRSALEAAMDAAPAAEGYVWCDARNAVTTLDDDGWCWLAEDFLDEHCPGPHRTLIIGPERA